MPLVTLPRLAIASVLILIATLAYGSQALFHHLEPGPLNSQEYWIFNGLVCSIWICYARACFVNPGSIPKSFPSAEVNNQVSSGVGQNNTKFRWCNKCEAVKSPRSHHCKVCKRCIPKMDHHCPWTANCVSHTTFPHFMRFLFFAVTAMFKLAQFQFTRLSVVWESRNLPSYLGPSATQLAALFILSGLNALTLFAVGVIFIRTVYSLGTNVTAIESWEIERHETLVHRARKRGGVLDGPDGAQIRIVKQEFPYDIGIWSNICQGMNGGPLFWLWPFARTPSLESGLDFETNDFEDPGTYWPPPDPDRMYRKRREVDMRDVALELDDDGLSNDERLREFRERQIADLRRRKTPSKPWKNSEGEVLADFGVDDIEDESFGEDDNVPIGLGVGDGAGDAPFSPTGGMTRYHLGPFRQEIADERLKMLLLDYQNILIESLLTERLFGASPTNIDQVVSDFDGVSFHISTPDAKSRIKISLSVKCFNELVNYGAQQILEREYGPYIVQAEPGYDFSLELNLDNLPAEKEAKEELVRKVSLLKRNVMAAPFERAFDQHAQMAEEAAKYTSESAPEGVKEGGEVMAIHYREEEAIYVKASHDRVTVIFSTVFREETDRVYGGIFLREFVDARRRAIQNAPQVLFRNEPPLELQNVPGVQNGANHDIGYITFVLFPRHLKKERREENISHIQTFRDYFHYHIKASKAYIHSRMRRRTADFIQVLNRARPENEEKERKTASGRTFRTQG